jgi:spoIIIJ-associated protein
MSRPADTSPEDRVRELVEEIVDALDLDAEVEVDLEGGEIQVRVEGEDLGAFIGRHGSTIDAVQHLAYKVAGTGDAAGPRVNVDAAGYRERRRQVLQRQADEAAERAVGTGQPVALDAMSAIERKVVHEHLKERGGVETWSEGQEPDRHLVVAPLG